MPQDAEVREAWWASVRALELEDAEALAAAQTRGELEATRAAHERALAVAPADVSPDLDSLSRTKAAAAAQAERARTAGNIDLEASAVALADELQAARDTLNVKQAAWNEWAEAHAAQKEAALAAQAELARRGQLDEPEAKADEPDVDAKVDAEVDEPLPGHIDPELAAQWKAEQQAQRDAYRQADREKWAERIPVTDAEVEAAQERDRAGRDAEPTAVDPEPVEPMSAHPEFADQPEAVTEPEPVAEAEVVESEIETEVPISSIDEVEAGPDMTSAGLRESEPEPARESADAANRTAEAETESLLAQIQADAEKAERAAAALEALEMERRAEVERAGRDEPVREPELEADGPGLTREPPAADIADMEMEL